MRSKIIPISNIARLSEAANALLTRAIGMPGMGVIQGPTGYGKSTAVTWIAIRLNGVYVRAQAMSTPASILESICEELSIGRRISNAATIREIVRKLAETGRPLFIDEADYLVKQQRLLEMLRDIHDLAVVPVVLIGMAGFCRKITHLQQLTGRIAQMVEFEAASIDDALLLSRELAEVTIAPELVRKLHDSARGSVRLIVVGLNRIEQLAKNRGHDRMTLADWPASTDFFVGSAPMAKKPAAIVAVN